MGDFHHHQTVICWYFSENVLKIVPIFSPIILKAAPSLNHNLIHNHFVKLVPAFNEHLWNIASGNCVTRSQYAFRRVCVTTALFFPNSHVT